MEHKKRRCPKRLFEPLFKTNLKMHLQTCLYCKAVHIRRALKAMKRKSASPGSLDNANASCINKQCCETLKYSMCFIHCMQGNELLGNLKHKMIANPGCSIFHMAGYWRSASSITAHLLSQGTRVLLFAHLHFEAYLRLIGHSEA